MKKLLFLHLIRLKYLIISVDYCLYCLLLKHNSLCFELQFYTANKLCKYFSLNLLIRSALTSVFCKCENDGVILLTETDLDCLKDDCSNIGGNFLQSKYFYCNNILFMWQLILQCNAIAMKR